MTRLEGQIMHLRVSVRWVRFVQDDSDQQMTPLETRLAHSTQGNEASVTSRACLC